MMQLSWDLRRLNAMWLIGFSATSTSYELPSHRSILGVSFLHFREEAIRPLTDYEANKYQFLENLIKNIKK